MIGISPGTRTLGFAIIQNGSLRDWGVKSFGEPWSEQKLQKILDTVENYIIRYEISVIALKTNHASRTSEPLEQIINGIQKLAKQYEIPCRCYTTSHLKEICNESSNKRSLIHYVYHRFPEVDKSINLTHRNLNYHLKTIEAVALVNNLKR